MKLTRKSILESKGFTCNNWSFINHKDKLVCFTGWIDLIDDQGRYIVLSDTQAVGKSGRRLPGFKVSLKHINTYIKEDGYKVCVLRHEAVDTTYERRTIKNVQSDLIFGNIEKEGSGYFLRPN